MKTQKRAKSQKYPKTYQFEYSDLTQLIRESLDFDARYRKFCYENPEYKVESWIELPPVSHQHQSYILNITIWKI